jgi:transposase-like protein
MAKRIVAVAQSQLPVPFDPAARAEELRKLLYAELDRSVVRTVYDLMRREVASLCGEPFSRKGDARLHRGGWAEGSIYLRGQRLPIVRPRVRADKGERDLQSYRAFRDRDVLSDDVARLLIRGVSTRDFGEAIDHIAEATALGRTTLSEAFKYASQKHLEELNGRSLADYRFPVLFFDGIEFAEMTLVVGLGITEKGEKVVLGLREGASENGEVCKDLMSSLVERGISVAAGQVLVVIDGSKALRKAIEGVWGKRALVARCRLHKTRNVLEYLSKSYHAEARRRLNAAWGMNEYEAAKAELGKTVRWLAGINESAAASLEEGLEETLTLHRLGLPEILRKSLASTNVIESAFSVVRARASRVKRWRSGQVARWAAAGLAFAEKRMKRIRGYKYLPLLIGKLQTLDVTREVA